MEKKTYEKPICTVETLEPLRILSGSGLGIKSVEGNNMDDWEVQE